jgi:hypothetical protein
LKERCKLDDSEKGTLKSLMAGTPVVDTINSKQREANAATKHVLEHR